MATQRQHDRLLAHDVDWDEVRGILTESCRKVAPKTLVKLLDA